MPAAPIVGAVIAIAAAAEIVTPVAIGLAVIATAGAVASTVGTITGDKTLSLVGNIMGAVGSIGGIANGLGFFGEAAAGALGGGAGVTNAAGGAAAEIAPQAVDTATATGGLNAYTPEFLNTFDAAYGASGSVEGALNSANPALAGAAGSTGQSGSVVQTLTGEVNKLTVASAEPPTPIQTSDFMAPAATNSAVNPEGLTPNPAADLAVEPTKGLINLPSAEPPPPVSPGELTDPAAATTPMVEAPSVTPQNYMNANVDQAAPTDPWGRPIEQGGGDGGSLGAFGDPDAEQTQLAQLQPTADPSTVPQPQLQSSMEPSMGPDVQRQVTTANQSPNDYGGAWSSGSQTGVSQPGQISGRTGLETPAPQAAQPSPTTTAANSSVSPGDAWIFAKNNPGSIKQVSSRPDSIWGDILGFAKENKSLVLGGMMTMGSFLTGALSPKTPAEVDALNAQAEKNRAQAQLEYTQNQMLQRRMANMSQPLPIARRGGLINMAVTGRPA